MFKIIDTQIQGLKIIETRIFEDDRCRFIKTINMLVKK